MRLTSELNGYAIQLLDRDIDLAPFHPAHIAAIYPASEGERVL
jgi:hypothetical protein